MKKHIFPYSFSLSFEDRGLIKTLPTVEISLMKENSQEEFSFLVLIDSGATISVFTKSDAELLGIALESGEKRIMESVSKDKFYAFARPVVIGIGGQKIKADVAFSERDDSPRLLGREQIFSRFFVIFDEKQKKTIFIPREEQEFEKTIYQ